MTRTDPLMAKPNQNKNISRAETFGENGKLKSGGWLVRFVRAGKSYQAYFGDSKHGGQRKALQAARLHRDEMAPKYSQKAPSTRAVNPSARNSSGVVGVRWLTRRVKKGKKTYEFIFATAEWNPEPGVRKTAAFSAAKHGEKKAWELACEARRKGILQLKRYLKQAAAA